MRVLQKIQLVIAMLCSFSIIFYTTLWLSAKVTLLFFPSITSILSTFLAHLYIVFSIMLAVKYGKRFGNFINYRVFRSPF